MKKIDITKYSDMELSLLVFNTEALYLMRRSRGFRDILDETFIYTDKQLSVLFADLQDDLN